MAVLSIIEYPDQRLRAKSRTVEVFDEDIVRLAEDLTETLQLSGGLGLSAPQVGEAVRIVVIDRTGDNFSPSVYVNPRILHQAARGFVQESCLSVPGITGNTMRSTQVQVQAQNVVGEKFEDTLSGMDAVSLLHEVDHLDGKLFTDRLSAFGRLRTRRKLKRLENAMPE